LYDVIVVGGGPAGSYVAGELAGMGHRVAVLERRKHPGGKLCAGIISEECVRHFAIEDNVILRRVNSVRLLSPSGKLIRLWREKTQACILDRAAFDQALAKQAQDKGADYLLDSEARNISISDSGVIVEVAGQRGEAGLEASAVVIAAGFGSKLVEELGLPKISDFVIGIQAEVETAGVEEIEVYFSQEIAPGFFAWLTPTSSQRALVGLLARHNPQFYIKKLMLSLLAQGKIVSAEVEPDYAGISLKPLSKTYGERVIVIGDAAGQVKPTTCGGIYYTLLCAEIAANTLHQALRGNDLSAKALAGYQRKWRRRLGRELGIGYYARRFYGRLSDHQIDRLFDIIISQGIDETLLKAEDLFFDWHGTAILRLMGHRAVSKAVELMKLPFRLGRKS